MAQDSTDPDNSTEIVADILNSELKEIKDMDYKRKAFLEAIKQNALSLEVVISNCRELFNRLKEFVQNKFKEEKENRDARIETKQEDINKKESKIEIIKDNREDKEAEIEKLKAEILDIKKEYDRLRRELGTKQSRPLRKFIEESQEDLNKLVDEQMQLLKKVFEMNDINLDKALEQRLKFFNKIKDHLEKSYTSFKEKAEKLHAEGRTSQSAYFMISIGIASTAASGWLYSLFLKKSSVRLDNPLFDLVADGYGFVMEFFSLSGNKLVGGFFAFFSLISLLTITTFFFKWLESVLQRLSDDRTNANIHINSKKKEDKKSNKEDEESYFNMNVQSTFNLNIQGTSFYSLWLQILPWLVMLIIVFIIISIGHTNRDSNFADLMTGQSLGSTLVLLCAGFTLLYITKIIEPRIDRNPLAKSWKNLGEVLIALSFFILIIVAIISWIFIGQQKPQGEQLVIILLFVGATLLSSLTIAYGLRDQSVFQQLNKLEVRLFSMVEAIDRFSNGLPLSQLLYNNRFFSSQILNTQRNLLSLIEEKARWQNQGRKTKPSLFHKFLMYMRSNRASPKEHSFTEFDQRYYPELVQAIRICEDNLSKAEERRDLLQRELEELQNETHPDLSKLLSEINTLKEQINNLIIARDVYQQRIHEQLTQLHKQEYLAVLETQEGYNLGQWWSQNSNRYE